MRMTVHHLISLFAFAAVLSGQSAPWDAAVRNDFSTERRVALVIGNSNYPTAPLLNPGNDARAMTLALKEIGFSVTTKFDTTLTQLEEATRDFVSSVRPNDVVLVYYSGHGMQMHVENYMIPVDFHAETQAEAMDRALNVTTVLANISRRNPRLLIVFLDACRTNPFRSWRSVEKGLAEMNGIPNGYFYGFATSPGNTASDNPAGRNGLFTQYLVKAIERGGEISEAFNWVRNEVYRASHGTQAPWSISMLIGKFNLRAQKSSGPRGADITSEPIQASATSSRATPPASPMLGSVPRQQVAPPIQDTPSFSAQGLGIDQVRFDNTRTPSLRPPAQTPPSDLPNSTAPTAAQTPVSCGQFGVPLRTVIDAVKTGVVTDRNSPCVVDKSDLNALRNLGWMGLLVGGDAATSRGNEILTIRADDLQGLLITAGALIDRKDYVRAASLMRPLAGSTDLSFVHAVYALSLAGAGQFDVALAECELAMRTAPNVPELAALRLKLRDAIAGKAPFVPNNAQGSTP